jgi:alanine racemase
MLTWIEIDTEKLRANIEAFRTLTQPDTALMVVVKANAYGHGLRVVASVAAERADWLGVNSCEEALEVSSLGVAKPVAILGHTPVDQLRPVIRNGYRQVVYRLDVATAMSREAEEAGKEAFVHLKVETGTNRQGIPVEDLEEFVAVLRRLPAINIEGVYTHFANIEDTLDPSFAQSQLQRFRQAVSILNSMGVRPPLIHAAATSGVLLYPETDFSMVRLGIGAYGVWPSRETQLAARERGRHITLAPILTWKTRVAQVKNLKAGEFVGYGLTYRASRPMQVVVVPVGYFDGYDRRLSNAGRALIHGQPVAVIGRVAMNMMMLDVTDVGAQPDDEVVLLGRQDASEIRVEELSEKAGTIPYETLCRINPLVPRVPYASR